MVEISTLSLFLFCLMLLRSYSYYKKEQLPRHRALHVNTHENNKVEPRITNGIESFVQEYPYFTQLFFSSGNGNISRVCAGVLIHSNWILTSAHCLTGCKTIIARIGFHNLTSNCTYEDPSVGCFSIALDHVQIHPEYNSDDNDADFALIFLEHAQNIRTPLLNQNYFIPKVNDTVIVIGKVGQQSGTGSGCNKDASTIPMVTELVVLSHVSCELFHDTAYITTNMQCAIGFGEAFFCVNDSGDPVIVKNNVDGEKDVLVGIISWVAEQECVSATKPMIYSRVSAVLSWIFSIDPDIEKH